jgi:hypothetical protein
MSKRQVIKDIKNELSKKHESSQDFSKWSMDALMLYKTTIEEICGHSDGSKYTDEDDMKVLESIKMKALSGNPIAVEIIYHEKII